MQFSILLLKGKLIFHSLLVRCVGDKIYGKRKQTLTKLGQMLSAVKLSFIHPTTKERMTFTCDVDDEFDRVLQEIKEKEL